MKTKPLSTGYRRVFLVILTFALWPACSTPSPTKEMSLEQAKQVTVSMSEAPAFVPPPRRIDDIAAILNQPGEVDKQLTEKFLARANAIPPSGAAKQELYTFYKDRGMAAHQLGMGWQALEDLRTALRYAEEAKAKDRGVCYWLAIAEQNVGNYKRAIDLLQSLLPAPNFPSVYARLAGVHTFLGNIEAAKEVKEKALLASRSKKSIRSPWWEMEMLYMDAVILEAQGKDEEAESYYRKYLSLFESNAKERLPGSIIKMNRFLINNLVRQQRLIEAEVEARKLLSQSIALEGKESYDTVMCLVILSNTLRAQGRLQEAEKLCSIGVDLLNRIHTPASSVHMLSARRVLGSILFAKGEYISAMGQYDLIKAAVQGDPYLFETMIVMRSPEMVLSLVMTGRPEEALKLADTGYEKFRKNHGGKSWITGAWQCMRGMAHFRLKNLKEAVKDFSQGMEIYLSNVPERRDYSRKRRFRIILDDYLRLLDEIRGSPLERELGRDSIAEAFRIAEASRGQTVQWALSASSARATVDDPETADLIRREQDGAQQIEVIESAIQELAATPPDQQDRKLLADMRTQMDTLRSAMATILSEIEKRSPKYAEIVRPKSASLSAIQATLRPGESLISIYTTETGTYVWALPFRGPVRFASVPMGKEELQVKVDTLRRALDSKPQTLNDIPEFDVNLAHQLFHQLLEPVEEGWKGAQDLLMTVNESLGQIPLAVLVTASHKDSEEKEDLFSRYRQVPWLIRKASITMLPSASSLVMLRTLTPPPSLKRLSFVGFGDPIFDPKQATSEERKENKSQVHVRGIRKIADGDLDGKQRISCNLSSLKRLPDTEEEITAICTTVSADPSKDVFLGKQASESRVKTMNLLDRQIIAFATHGLVPGDLDGLDQPAIALSSPAVTKEKDDGLLTMGEIMKLKLNADWVVLSACNTAASDGKGAEALSGLGRAFFYAGTRSILASMYPVETTSARKLVTTAFKCGREDRGISRARALQRSMVDVMTGPGLVDPATGRVACSYAHPFFWAPFILVGDPGGISK